MRSCTTESNRRSLTQFEQSWVSIYPRDVIARARVGLLAMDLRLSVCHQSVYYRIELVFGIEAYFGISSAVL